MSRFYFLLILLIFCGRAAHAQDDAFYLRQDLHLDWVYYDEDEELMLPFLENSKDMPRAIHLKFAPGYGKSAILKIRIPSNTSLFIDNRLIQYLERDTVMYFSADSLSQSAGFKEFFITLFNKKGFRQPVEAAIGFRHKQMDRPVEVNPVKARNTDSAYEYIKLVMLLIFFYFVMVYTIANTELFDFYDFRWLFSFKYTDTIIMKYRTFNKQQLLVVVFYSALLAGLFLVFHRYSGSVFTFDLAGINPLIEWLFLTLFILVLIFLKFALVTVISLLFRIGDRINLYMVEYLRAGTIFFSIVFLVVAYTLINHPGNVSGLLNGLTIFVILFYFGRFILLFFKIQLNTSMKILHLFSYLCTTELIPMIIGIKYFLK